MAFKKKFMLLAFNSKQINSLVSGITVYDTF